MTTPRAAVSGLKVPVASCDIALWDRELSHRGAAIFRTMARAAVRGLTAYGAMWVPQAVVAEPTPPTPNHCVCGVCTPAR
jgi:hypothetical protein